MSNMKDHYTLELSGHQARGLNAMLELVKQLMAVPENVPVYPNLMTEGIGLTLIKSEVALLQQDIVRQFEEQDKSS
jgi:hypothetical protein